MSDPIPLKVTRWKCPHCNHTRAHKKTSVEHIARCWHNPENQTCATCANWQPPGNGARCFPERDCDCDVYPQDCGAGEVLDPDETPRMHCPKWEVIL